MYEEGVHAVELHFPTFGLQPALHLLHRRLLGALAGIAAENHARLQHHEVAAFERTSGDHVVDRDAVVLVKLDHRRVLATAPPLGHLGDDRTEGRHHTGVSGEHLILQVRVRRQHVHVHPRFPIRV
ncbi:hypothetical protein D9M72_558510 [compost metagenome]